MAIRERQTLAGEKGTQDIKRAELVMPKCPSLSAKGSSGLEE